MISNLQSAINFGVNVYLLDFLDIIIISVMIYFVLFFLKQTRSTLSVIGIGILVALYITAQVFNLYLTSLVLQAFFGIFLIILVIVFQDELRRFFEYLATFSTRQIKPKKGKSTEVSMVGVLAQTAANLSRNRVGGLFVIQGKESLDHYLESGEVLDGIISSSTLESIFDPNTPGHDGAVIIAKNRISKFGVKLPLSTNYKQLGKKGTRHTSALGISEKTDAFVVVVSEETGKISVAQEGKIRELKDADELETRLNKFLKEKFPQEPQSALEGFIKKNWTIKLTAILLAAVFWFFAVFQVEVVQRSFDVPVTYRSVPQNVSISDTRPDEVTVTLEARGQTAFSRLEEDDVEIVINGSEITPGVNTITLQTSSVRVPSQFIVLDISPTAITVIATQTPEEEEE